MHSIKQWISSFLIEKLNANCTLKHIKLPNLRINFKQVVQNADRACAEVNIQLLTQGQQGDLNQLESIKTYQNMPIQVKVLKCTNSFNKEGFYTRIGFEDCYCERFY